MPPGIIRRTIADKVADLQERVTKLEGQKAAAVIKAVFDLSRFRDVRVLYKHPTEAPKDGQLFRWHADDTVPTYKGWWEPGAKVVKGYATDSGTGDLSISVDLVDGDWDTTRACHVEATMLIDPAYGPEPIPGDFTVVGVVIDGAAAVPVTFPEAAGLQGYVQSPVATIQLIDADAGPGAPSADIEVATRSWAVADPDTVGGGDAGGTISWTFVGGTPHIEANIAGVDTDAWPESHAIYVIWRLTYL